MLRTKLDTASLDELATGVAELDADGRVAYANPAFIEHTGYGLSRLLGQTLEVLKPEGGRLQAMVLRLRAEHGTLGLPGVAVCATPGNEVRLDFSFTPSENGVWIETHPAGTATGATRVSESLRGFAHEIRNPLAAISGAAQLLEQRDGDACGQRACDAGARRGAAAGRTWRCRHRARLRSQPARLARRSRPPAAGDPEPHTQRGASQRDADRAAQPRRSRLARCARTARTGVAHRSGR